MYNSVPDERARERLISSFDWETHDPRHRARLPVRHRAARPRRDADGQRRAARRTRMSLLTTPSQTVGPYLHIGFAAARHSTTSRRRACAGERITHRGPRRSTATASRSTTRCVEIWQANAHGQYAHPEDAQDSRSKPGFRGFGRVPTDARRRVPLHDDQAGPRARPRRRAAGAASRRHGLHARPAEASAHAHLLSRRSGQRRRPGAAARARGAACDADRAARRPHGAEAARSNGTSSCRARTKPCSSITDCP